MSREVVSLDQARQLTPKVTDVAGCIMRLQGAVFDSVSEADIRLIMEKQKQKALDGDSKAAQFLLNMLANPKVSYTRRDVNVTTTRRSEEIEDREIIEATDDESSQAVDRTEHVRKEAALKIIKVGVVGLSWLCKYLDVDSAEGRRVLGKPLFKIDSDDQVELTEQGRQYARNLKGNT